MRQAFILVLLAITPGLATAQTRERIVVTFRDATATIEIAASNEGEVLVRGREGVDHVRLGHSPSEVRAWADSTERMMAVPLSADPRERVTLRGPWLGGADLHWMKEIREGVTSEYIYLSDRYGVNSVMLAVTPARARAFVVAMRDAATQTIAMSPQPKPLNVPAIVNITNSTHFSFQVDEEVVPFMETIQVAYPEALRVARESGWVEAQFVVNVDGRVEPATFKVLRSTNDLFTAAVRAHLPRMRFSPAKVQSKPVRQLVQQRFEFNIVR